MVRITINKIFGDQIFGVDDKYINIPSENKFKKVPFPDIYKVIQLNGSRSIDN